MNPKYSKKVTMKLIEHNDKTPVLRKLRWSER